MKMNCEEEEMKMYYEFVCWTLRFGVFQGEKLLRYSCTGNSIVAVLSPFVLKHSAECHMIIEVMKPK